VQEIFVSSGFKSCLKGSMSLENVFCEGEARKQDISACLFAFRNNLHLLRQSVEPVNEETRIDIFESLSFLAN